MKKLTNLDLFALILLMIGGLQWGLIGLGMSNIVEMILGSGLSHLVYILVGLSAVYIAWLWMKLERK